MAKNKKAAATPAPKEPKKSIWLTAVDDVKGVWNNLFSPGSMNEKEKVDANLGNDITSLEDLKLKQLLELQRREAEQALLLEALRKRNEAQAAANLLLQQQALLAKAKLGKIPRTHDAIATLKAGDVLEDGYVLKQSDIDYSKRKLNEQRKPVVASLEVEQPLTLNVDPVALAEIKADEDIVEDLTDKTTSLAEQTLQTGVDLGEDKLEEAQQEIKTIEEIQEELRVNAEAGIAPNASELIIGQKLDITLANKSGPAQLDNTVRSAVYDQLFGQGLYANDEGAKKFFRNLLISMQNLGNMGTVQTTPGLLGQLIVGLPSLPTLQQQEAQKRSEELMKQQSKLTDTATKSFDLQLELWKSQGLKKQDVVNNLIMMGADFHKQSALWQADAVNNAFKDITGINVNLNKNIMDYYLEKGLRSQQNAVELLKMDKAYLQDMNKMKFSNELQLLILKYSNVTVKSELMNYMAQLDPETLLLVGQNGYLAVTGKSQQYQDKVKSVDVTTNLVLNPITKILEGIGKVIHKNDGGTVPGKGSSDTVPAMLTPGEFVITKEQVSSILKNGMGSPVIKKIVSRIQSELQTEEIDD